MIALSSARLRLAIVVASLLVAAPFAGASPVSAGSTNLLPDLRMAPFYEVQLQTSPGGQKKLRFGTIVFNVGDGPLEVRGKHPRRGEMQTVVQRIYRSDGSSFRVLLPAARMFYSGDGHDHYHFRRFIVVRLTPTSPSLPAGGSERSLRKIGFCLIDARPMPEDQWPPQPAPPGYGSCGTLASTSVRMGISVGWGDDYPPLFAHQAINVTGLPAGTYRMCATTNGNHVLREKGNNHSNNSYWADLTLNPATNDVDVIAEGNTAC